MTADDAEFKRTFTASASEVAVVRHAFAGWLAEHRVNGIRAEDWSLVMSELVANACTASPADSTVDVHATFADGVTLMVRNRSGGTVPKVGRGVTGTALSGRGLLIVEHLTDSLVFDVNGDDVRVVCWASLTPPGSASAAS